MSVRARVLVALALAIAVACSDSTGPVAGSLTVSLTTPNSGLDEGVLLVLSAPAPPTAMQAAGALALWRSTPASTVDTLALTGTLASGPLVTLAVSDVNQLSHYHAQLLQVAAAGTHTLRALTGYSVTVTK